MTASDLFGRGIGGNFAALIALAIVSTVNAILSQGPQRGRRVPTVSQPRVPERLQNPRR
jgi:hypothetical protein